MKTEKTHWLQSPNKNYFGHWDIPEGGVILTIQSAKWEEVENPVLKKGDPKKFEAHRVVRFNEDYKPLICNQTNAQSVLKSTGIKYMEDSIGQRIELYVGSHFDRTNKENIDCVRIRNEKPREQDQLPEITNFDEAVNYLNGGKSIKDLKKIRRMSDDMELNLIAATS
jgi:hypothetical protein